MGEQRISKATSLTVVSGRRFISVHAGGGQPAIFEEQQHFRLMHKHLTGSNRPRGHFHKGWGSDQEVEVRWLWTESNGYFAPEITFRPTKLGISTAKTVGGVLAEMNEKEGPDGLITKIRATVVEYIDDQKDGCWDDYRPLCAPGDSEMMVIARAAQGD